MQNKLNLDLEELLTFFRLHQQQQPNQKLSSSSTYCLPKQKYSSTSLNLQRISQNICRSESTTPEADEREEEEEEVGDGGDGGVGRRKSTNIAINKVLYFELEKKLEKF